MLLNKPGIQSSISSYYYTPMRDVFVGTMCAIAVFMMSYKGYERKDGLAGVLACIFGVCVAFFPTTPDSDPTSRQKLVGYIHLISAALYFLTLAYFSLVLFTKTDKSKVCTRRKLQRNTVYKICGYSMLLSLCLIVVLHLFRTRRKSKSRSSRQFLARVRCYLRLRLFLVYEGRSNPKGLTLTPRTSGYFLGYVSGYPLS